MVASEECDNGGASARAFTQVMFCCHRPQSESFSRANPLRNPHTRRFASFFVESQPPWTTCAHKVQPASQPRCTYKKSASCAMGQCWFAPLASEWACERARLAADWWNEFGRHGDSHELDACFSFQRQGHPASRFFPPGRQRNCTFRMHVWKWINQENSAHKKWRAESRNANKNICGPEGRILLGKRMEAEFNQQSVARIISLFLKIGCTLHQTL